MRRLLLVVGPLVMLAGALPASAQGVQTPGAPNATRPYGTVPDASSRRLTRPGPAQHRHRAHHRRAVSDRPAAQAGKGALAAEPSR